MIAQNRYRAGDVPVRGGQLRVGVWEPTDTDSSVPESPGALGAAAEARVSGEMTEVPTVIAVHGVTASHRCWLTMANALPGFRVVAPDLRGRGRSRDLPGPYGMAQHADDIAAVMDYLDLGPTVLVGHSMGGFVAAAMYGRYPERVSSLVLVDGGLPLPQPEGMTPEELTTARLGLAKQRLSMTFPDRESYQAFFRAHPAFAADWSEAVADYVDYDLIGTAPNLQSATPLEAMAEDSADLQNGGEWLMAALTSLPDATVFLRAERGLAGEKPGLYEDDWISRWQPTLPNIAVRDVLGVNHYTILFSEHGIRMVAAAVQAAARLTR